MRFGRVVPRRERAAKTSGEEERVENEQRLRRVWSDVAKTDLLWSQAPLSHRQAGGGKAKVTAGQDRDGRQSRGAAKDQTRTGKLRPGSDRRSSSHWPASTWKRRRGETRDLMDTPRRQT
ncbi:hypothetical protein ERJ75_001165900 [Trypanosoma vivax]|nr:hypothetical protein ERJ75_001165900 [Trypanosoma vivax]